MDENFKKIFEAYQGSNAFGKLLGMTLDLAEPGHVVYSMEVRSEHLATPKAAHGGSVAALMDGLLGVTALSEVAKEKKVVSTVEFKINYLNPGLKGQMLIAEGKTLHKGNKLIVVSGEIRDQGTKTLIAHGIGTFNSYPAEKTGLFV